MKDKDEVKDMVHKQFFGRTSNGEDVYAYRIDNGRGIVVTVLD